MRSPSVNPRPSTMKIQHEFPFVTIQAGGTRRSCLKTHEPVFPQMLTLSRVHIINWMQVCISVQTHCSYNCSKSPSIGPSNKKLNRIQVSSFGHIQRGETVRGTEEVKGQQNACVGYDSLIWFEISRICHPLNATQGLNFHVNKKNKWGEKKLYVKVQKAYINDLCKVYQPSTIASMSAAKGKIQYFSYPDSYTDAKYME